MAALFAAAGCGDDASGPADDGGTEDVAGDEGGEVGPTCPDPLEPNDDTATATALAVSAATPRATQSATIDSTSADFFSFVVPLDDPTEVTVSYTAGASDTETDLRFFVRDVAGTSVAEAWNERTEASETERAWLNASTGTEYSVEVTGGGAACAGYDIVVDAAICTDADEDNDAQDDPAPLATGTAVERTTWQDDADYFRFATPLDDPVRVTLSYTVPATDTDSDLRLFAYDLAGTSVAEAWNERTGTTETEETWWQADTATEYVLLVEGAGASCVEYSLLVDPAACTDPDEDNDDTASAADLPVGTPLERTNWQEDLDYYRVSTTSAGPMSVTVSYTVDAADTGSDLRVFVYDAAGGDVAQAWNTRTGTSETETATWDAVASAGPYVVLVEGAGGVACVTYTIEAASG
ncbi:MAG: hypothetical protein HY907_12120 [Deltaproteobacteria bacterium]|nr:hypothetical protein [Deltaproteobacteria bacterium]